MRIEEEEGEKKQGARAAEGCPERWKRERWNRERQRVETDKLESKTLPIQDKMNFSQFCSYRELHNWIDSSEREDDETENLMIMIRAPHRSAAKVSCLTRTQSSGVQGANKQSDFRLRESITRNESKTWDCV